MSAEKIQPNPEEAPTQDAELAAEGMQSGNEKKQFVDVEADYEASKQYSVSEMDKSGKGEEAAKEATSSNKKPQNMTDQPEETQKSTKAEGNPDAFKGMAKDINKQSQ